MIYSTESPNEAIKAGYNIIGMEYFRLNPFQRLSHNRIDVQLFAGEKTIPAFNLYRICGGIETLSRVIEAARNSNERASLSNSFTQVSNPVIFNHRLGLFLAVEQCNKAEQTKLMNR